MPKTDSVFREPHELAYLHNRFVTVVGNVASVVVEKNAEDDRKIDHVWIDVRAGDFGLLRVALSTSSRYNLAGNFDPRVRLGLVTSMWDQLPVPGVKPADPLDYHTLEEAHSIEYVIFERPTLEELLVAKARHALVIQATGEFYVRAHAGVHQIHSCRGSLGMPRDIAGRDGTIQFYFQRQNVREMLLFKFAGQP